MKCLKLIPLIFLFLLTGNSHAQTFQIDSLKAILVNLEEDTSKVNTLNAMASNVFRSAPDEAIKIGSEAKILAEQLNYQEGLAYALKSIGLGYYMQGNYVEASINWEQSLEIFKTLDNENGIANILGNLGTIHGTLGEDDQAIEYHLQSLKIAEKRGDSIRINYGFLIPKNNKLYLSTFSTDVLLPACQDIEPTIPALRKIFYQIIKNKVVPWIIYFNLDDEMFKISIPNDWLELLELADLLNFEDKEVQDWWHSLIKVKSDIDEAKQKSIGDIGEKLTYDFEKERIHEDGISNAENKVIWVSNISDEYGFDILSLAGKALRTRIESDNIYIEVKASELSNPKLFTFYISENEWKKAEEFNDDYYFFLLARNKIK